MRANIRVYATAGRILGMRRKLAVGLACAVVGLVFVGAVSAQTRNDFEYDPYSADPLGLIALYEVSTYYTSQIDVDIWDVWVCEMAGGTADFHPEYFVKRFTAKISPLFDWLSRGKYRPTFRVGGTVRTAHPPSFEGSTDCQDSVMEASRQPLVSYDDAGNAALIIANSDIGEYEVCGWSIPWILETHSSYDTQGIRTSRSVNVRESGKFPNNDRIVFIYGDAPTPYTTCFVTSVAAHEIGHQLGWPHSFSGQTIIGSSNPSDENDGWIDEYDNWADFMSGALSGRTFQDDVGYIGTPAINRYAAGWIDPSEVAIHPGGPDSITYNLIGLDDIATSYNLALSNVFHPKPTIQMLVLASADGPGVFDVLSVRTQSGFDARIPHEGVERYKIDQRPSACEYSWPVWNPTCHLLERRTIPVPYEIDEGTFLLDDGAIINHEGSSAHMYLPGESFETEGLTVTIDQSQDDIYTVTVTS